MIGIEQFYFQIIVGFFTALAGTIIYRIIGLDITKIIIISFLLVIVIPVLPYTVISSEITFKERIDFLNSYLTNIFNLLPSILAGDIGALLVSKIENNNLFYTVIIGLVLGILLILASTMIDSQENIEPDTIQENITEQINSSSTSNVKEQSSDQVILLKKLVCYDTISSKINKVMESHPKITYNCELILNDTGFANLTCPNRNQLNFQINNANSFHTFNANYIELEEDYMIQYKTKGVSKSCIDEAK